MNMSVGIFVSNLIVATLVGALAVPLIRRRVKMNDVYGVRIPRAFESDEQWYRINEYGGRRLLAWSVVIALLGIVALFVRDERVLVALALAPLLYLVACVDAWRYSKRR